MCVITPEWTHSTWNQVWTLSNLMAFPPCIAELYCDSRFCSPTNNIADNSHYLYTYGYTMWDYAFQFRAWSKCLQDVLYILTRAGCVDKLICTWLSLPHFSCACIVHISETTSFFSFPKSIRSKKNLGEEEYMEMGDEKRKRFLFFFHNVFPVGFPPSPERQQPIRTGSWTKRVVGSVNQWRSAWKAGLFAFWLCRHARPLDSIPSFCAATVAQQRFENMKSSFPNNLCAIRNIQSHYNIITISHLGVCVPSQCTSSFTHLNASIFDEGCLFRAFAYACVSSIEADFVITQGCYAKIFFFFKYTNKPVSIGLLFILSRWCGRGTWAATRGFLGSASTDVFSRKRLSAYDWQNIAKYDT